MRILNIFWMFFDRIEEYYAMMQNRFSQAILSIGSYFLKIILILESYFLRILAYFYSLQNKQIWLGTTIETMLIMVNYDLRMCKYYFNAIKMHHIVINRIIREISIKTWIMSSKIIKLLLSYTTMWTYSASHHLYI